MGTLLNYRVTPKCINVPLNTFSFLLHRFIEIYLHIPNTFKLFFKLATNKIFLFLFFLKKEKSPSSALADVHTHTQIQIRREMLLYLTHKGGSIQKAYRVSSKNLPLPKSRLYKFSLWDRLKQEALCNTLWCLGMMSASRFAGTWEELKVPCQIQNTKLAVPDTSL